MNRAEAWMAFAAASVAGGNSGLAPSTADRMLKEFDERFPEEDLGTVEMLKATLRSVRQQVRDLEAALVDTRGFDG